MHMKYDNELQEEIISYFRDRQDFFEKSTPLTFFFDTWPKGEEKYIISSKKPHGNKNMVSASVSVYRNIRYPENEKYGVELKIDMYMWGYQSEEPVFQGWVENMEELKVIVKSVGL